MKRELQSRGRVVRAELRSRCLRGNPLGDPAARVLPVYLPPGYDGSPARYPVLYALAGFTGCGAQMLNVAGWGESMEQRLNRLYAERRIGPMIVVFPDCFTRYGGSQYVLGGGGKLRAVPDRRGRAVRGREFPHPRTRTAPRRRRQVERRLRRLLAWHAAPGGVRSGGLS